MAGSGSENFDVGAMVVGPQRAGEKLVEAVGGAGIAWNLKAKQTFDVHGYPAEEPFDGETQRICRGAASSATTPTPSSSRARSTSRSPAASPAAPRAAAGSIEGDTLNSVTDYGYFDEASPAFGAYFGKEVARLYGRAAKVRCDEAPAALCSLLALALARLVRSAGAAKPRVQHRARPLPVKLLPPLPPSRC